MTGFIIYLLNVPICWQSKSQKGVTLLSAEAKYVAISEAVNELKFIYYLLSDLHIKVNLPIVMKTDNIGAIFMSENASTAFVLGGYTLPLCPRTHLRLFYQDRVCPFN
jgi:hypothetical protein